MNRFISLLFIGVVLITSTIIFFIDINKKEKSKKMKTNNDVLGTTLPKYNILKSEELIHLYDNEEYNVIDQIDYNKAIIEILSNGNYLLRSSHGNVGIIFYEKQVMDSMISGKVYPKETDTDNFFDIYKEETKCLIDSPANGILFFEELFKSKSGFNFDYGLTESFLNKLTNTLREKKKGDEEVFDEFANVTLLLIQEAFRKLMNGKWAFHTEYTFNTFLTPYLVDKDNKIVFLSTFISYHYDDEAIDLKMNLTEIVQFYIEGKQIQFNVREMSKKCHENFDVYFHHYLTLAANK